jgi:hypothetical protein
MKAVLEEEWNTSIDGGVSDSIPLWKALARFTSPDDLHAGMVLNESVIKNIKSRYRALYEATSIVSLIGIVLLVAYTPILLAWLFFVGENNYVINVILAVLLVLALGPKIVRRIHQYGINRLYDPLTLNFESNQYFDEFIGYLQRGSQPHAYYVTRFGGKRKYLDRREFFGRLRYLLFSEHPADRRLVTRYEAWGPLPSDIFIHRDNLEIIQKLRESAPQKPKGVDSKYPYEDAIIAVLNSNEVKLLNLKERDAALKALRTMIVDWLKEINPAEGNSPRTDYDRVR